MSQYSSSSTKTSSDSLLTMANPSSQQAATPSIIVPEETQPLLQNHNESQTQLQQPSTSPKGRNPHTRIVLRIFITIYILITLALGLYFVVGKALDSIGPIGTYPTTTYIFVDPTPVDVTPTWSMPLPDVTWRAQGYELRREERLTFVRVSGHTATASR